jgi:hypothetical protein
MPSFGAWHKHRYNHLTAVFHPQITQIFADYGLTWARCRGACVKRLGARRRIPAIHFGAWHKHRYNFIVSLCPIDHHACIGCFNDMIRHSTL